MWLEMLSGLAWGLYIGYFGGKVAVNVDHQIDTKIEMCQAELPRNQKCILVAVPMDKD